MEKNKPRILLVEDDPDHAELVERGFAEACPDCHITHVSDGEEALDYFHSKGGSADLEPDMGLDVVLLDLRLPRIDGFEVLRSIKTDERLRRLPVVVLSTSAAETDILKAYDCGANSYLVKPTSFVKYAELIRDIGAYWLRWNQRCRRNGRKKGASGTST